MRTERVNVCGYTHFASNKFRDAFSRSHVDRALFSGQLIKCFMPDYWLVVHCCALAVQVFDINAIF